MNPTILLGFLAEQLRRLPDAVRNSLYVGYAVIALSVTVLELLDVTSVFGVRLVDVGKVLVVLAPLFGFTASANVKRTATVRDDRGAALMLAPFLSVMLASCLLVVLAIVSAPRADAAGAVPQAEEGVPCNTLNICPKLYHYSPDDGYDPPIIITCKWGNGAPVPGYDHGVAEGQWSTRYCEDMDGIYIRAGEELWCKAGTATSGYYWTLAFDATGWHKVNDLWSDLNGCTLRVD